MLKKSNIKHVYEKYPIVANSWTYKFLYKKDEKRFCRHDNYVSNIHYFVQSPLDFNPQLASYKSTQSSTDVFSNQSNHTSSWTNLVN